MRAKVIFTNLPIHLKRSKEVRFITGLQLQKLLSYHHFLDIRMISCLDLVEI